MPSLVQDLDALAALHKKGELTAEQFAEARQFIIDEHKKLATPRNKQRKFTSKKPDRLSRGKVWAVVIGVTFALAASSYLTRTNETAPLAVQEVVEERASGPVNRQSQADTNVRSPATVMQELPPEAGPASSNRPTAIVQRGAAYLPDRMMHLMPQLQSAIRMVSEQHKGCRSIDNASYSETYARSGQPAFFVSCEMSGSRFPFQNVYVRGGRIVGTTP